MNALLGGFLVVFSLWASPVISGGTAGSNQYWDCCKPACGWPSIANTDSPVAACAADGTTVLDVYAATGCEGGIAYTCNNEMPIVVNSSFAYGFVAFSPSDADTDNPYCCRCFHIAFQGELAGKEMEVQVINSDSLKDHFVIAIPGGGVGDYSGCDTQWGAPTDGWGQRYGGVSSIEECSELPEVLQSGCRFRYEWLMGVNPDVTYNEITCPTELTSITGCTYSG